MGWPGLKLKGKGLSNFSSRYLHPTAHADGTFWVSEFVTHMVRYESMNRGKSGWEAPTGKQVEMSLKDVAHAGPFANLDEARHAAEGFNATQGWGQDGAPSVTEIDALFQPGCVWATSAEEAEAFRRDEERVFQILRDWPREWRGMEPA